MKIKVSMFLYLLILCIIGYYCYGLWQNVRDETKFVFSEIGTIVFMLYSLFVGLSSANNDIEIGKSFISDYLDYKRPLIVRFSPFHFVIFILNQLIGKPFMFVKRWCDDKLSIGYGNKR